MRSLFPFILAAFAVLVTADDQDEADIDCANSDESIKEDAFDARKKACGAYADLTWSSEGDARTEGYYFATLGRYTEGTEDKYSKCYAFFVSLKSDHPGDLDDQLKLQAMTCGTGFKNGIKKCDGGFKSEDDTWIMEYVFQFSFTLISFAVDRNS